MSHSESTTHALSGRPGKWGIAHAGILVNAHTSTWKNAHTYAQFTHSQLCVTLHIISSTSRIRVSEGGCVLFRKCVGVV